MNLKLKSALGIAALALGAQAMAQVTFYEGEGFRGRAFNTEQSVNNFERYGFNAHASSVVVDQGRWEVCDDANFAGTCVVVGRGSYDSLNSMGLHHGISSVRAVAPSHSHAHEVAAPLTTPNYEYRRRPTERVFEAPISTVRAVVGPPEQRCWIERQQVTQQAPRSNNDIGAAILGGLIGGVLGHQVGGGSGKDLATVGGVVAGAAVGNNLGGRSGGGTNIVDRDVQRCETTQNATPAYYDVTYNFRGLEHRVQMSAPPGATIAVNDNGEPRQ